MQISLFTYIPDIKTCLSPRFAACCGLLEHCHLLAQGTVFRQRADRDVLLVAAEIGKGQCPLVQNLEEAHWPAAVLDVRLAVGVGGPQVEGIPLGDKSRELRGDGLRPAASLF